MKTLTKFLVFPFLFLSFSLLAQDETPSPKLGDVLFQVVEEMPTFHGCENTGDATAKRECTREKISAFVSEHLQYPKAAIQEGIEGKAIIRTILAKDGSIHDAEIRRNPGAGCGEEALRVVRMMPKWIP